MVQVRRREFCGGLMTWLKRNKEFPEERYNINNGQTLCVECHKKTKSYGWSKYWHKKIAENRLFNTQESMF